MKRTFLILMTCLSMGTACAEVPELTPSDLKVEEEHNGQVRSVYHLNIEKQYLDDIIAGKKVAEGRLNLPDFSAMKVGDLIYFWDNEGGQATCTVISVGRYDTFEKMLVSDGVVNMLPDIDPNNNTYNEMVIKGTDVYQSFPGYKNGVKIYGAIAFGLRYDNNTEDLSKVSTFEVKESD